MPYNHQAELNARAKAFRQRVATMPTEKLKWIRLSMSGREAALDDKRERKNQPGWAEDVARMREEFRVVEEELRRREAGQSPPVP